MTFVPNTTLKFLYYSVFELKRYKLKAKLSSIMNTSGRFHLKGPEKPKILFPAVDITKHVSVGVFPEKDTVFSQFVSC